MRTAKQKKQDHFRAKENASKYHWDLMTKQEKEWLIAFELSEHETERGHIYEAIAALIDVGVTPSIQYVKGLRASRLAHRDSNPTLSDIKIKADRKYDNYQGIRAPKSNSYDALDYARVMRSQNAEDTLTRTDLTDGFLSSLKKEMDPDNTAMTVNPEDGLINAIDAARAKGNRSLEKLIEDAKLSKEAKEDLLARTQTMTYTGMTYTLHGTEFMNLNYVLQARNGQLYVQDQHDRIQTLALYLKRHTADSYATHAIVSYPSQPIQTWVFKAGHRSNVEGSAIQWVS